MRARSTQELWVVKEVHALFVVVGGGGGIAEGSQNVERKNTHILFAG